jgi:hypothetical protein
MKIISGSNTPAVIGRLLDALPKFDEILRLLNLSVDDVDVGL